MAPKICTNLGDPIISMIDELPDMVRFSKEELIGHDSKPFTYPNDVGIIEERLRRVTWGEADEVRWVERCPYKDS